MLEWVKKHKEEGERGCVYEREIEKEATNSVTRLGDFLKSLGIKFSYRSSPNIW